MIDYNGVWHLPFRPYDVVNDWEAPYELRQWVGAAKVWLRTDLRLPAKPEVKFFQVRNGYRREWQERQEWAHYDIGDDCICVNVDCPVSEVCEVIAHEAKHLQQWLGGSPADEDPNRREQAAMDYASFAVPRLVKAINPPVR